MLDIKLIRECPDKINELLKRRNPELSIDEVLKIDEERRKIQTQADELRAKRKNDSQKIGLMKKNGEKIWKMVNHCFIFAPAFEREGARERG